MNKKLSLMLLMTAIALASHAQLQNTGWKRPTATHLPNGWTNPQNAFASDDQYAEVLHQSGCRCPFMDLSWDDGIGWTSSNIFGPYGTTDSWRTQGDSTDGWGHAWTESELSDSVFVLRIWNSSTLIRQGYSNFGFGIPTGSAISGIEVRVEAHGDSNYTYDRVDVIEAKVYYTMPTAVNEAFEGEEMVSVFPNPARHFIHIRFTRDHEPQKLQILNPQGAHLFENTTSEIIAGNNYEMDVSSLVPGIYFLNIIGRERTINTRIIIQ